jgi:hypothetical protein
MDRFLEALESLDTAKISPFGSVTTQQSIHSVAFFLEDRP